MDLTGLFERLKQLLPRGSFLVGGGVRDRILGTDPKDMDFLVPDDPFKIGPTLAQTLEGFFVPLDDDRRIARVVLRGGFDIDLLPIPAGGIAASLAERDFTINAIALSLDTGALTDPFSGQADIRARRIRFVDVKNLDEDPLRILRVWRFRAALGFTIDPALLTAVRERNGKIWSVAPERIAEEWFLILGADGAGKTIREMADAGTLIALFSELLPMRGCAQNEFHHLDVFDHSLAAVSAIDAINAAPEKFIPQRAVETIREYLDRPMIGRRKRAAYLRFACLLHDIEKPSTKAADEEGRIHFYGHEKAGEVSVGKICDKLRLARAESDLLRLFVAQHMIFGPGVYEPGANLDRFFYRLFRDFGGDDGLGLLIVSLADREASLGPAVAADFNEKHKKFVGDGILRYLEQKSRVFPPKLLSGEDVMNTLKIPAGPKVGQILERVRELQAEGKIHTREEAIELLPRLHA